MGEIYCFQKFGFFKNFSDLKVFSFYGWNKVFFVEFEFVYYCFLREVIIVYIVWDMGCVSLWSFSVLGFQFLRRLVGLMLIKLLIRFLLGFENFLGLEFLNFSGCV